MARFCGAICDIGFAGARCRDDCGPNARKITRTFCRCGICSSRHSLMEVNEDVGLLQSRSYALQPDVPDVESSELSAGLCSCRRSDFRTLPLCVRRPCGASQYPSCGPVLRQQVLLLQKALRRRPQDERESRARLHPGLSAEVLSSRECPGDLRREVPKLQGHCLSRCALPCVAVPCASCLRADRSEAMTTEGTEP